MLYQLYQTGADAGDLARDAVGSLGRLTRHLPGPVARSLPVRSARAACEVVAGARITHERPPFGIDRVVVDGVEVGIVEDVVDRTPFGSLLHFRKDVAVPQPVVLLVSPLSGHFSTLLRATVQTMLRDHDVYLADWHNVRDVPLAEGDFGFDDYVDHVIRFVERLGDAVHLVSVCQPCVPVLAAAAVMAQGRHPQQPRTLILMAGPIDTRINPTEVNELATGNPLSWFERNVITTVPARHPGAGRRVYPGFLQLTAFMMMNPDRHVRSHVELWGSLTRGDLARARATREFYEEYFAVLDMPAEFYLQTISRVFQRFELARGVLEHRGRRVEPQAIRRTALMTVEGERDDICSIGQTMAAHDLCSSVPAYRRLHHLQAGVGHYGVFSGRRWDGEIYPRVRNFILAHG